MITQEPTIFLQGISLSDFLNQVRQAASIESSSNDNADEVMNIEQTAIFVKLSIPTIWRKKLKGEIPYVQIDGRVLFRRSQLIAWMNDKSTQSKVHTR